MNIQEQLQHDLKESMRAGDKPRIGVIRMALAALQNAQMALVKEAFDATAPAEGEESPAQIVVTLSPEAMQDTIVKQVKQRRDAADIYRKNRREDLAVQEEGEAAILETYLPRQLSADELRPLLADAIQQIGARGPGDMGKVMPVLMQQFKGRADGRLISQLARELLAR